MTRPRAADAAYRRLVGLIGAPATTTPLGLVEVELVREIVDTASPSGARNRGTILVRELDHRVGAVLTLTDIPDSARVPMDTDELETLHEIVKITRQSKGRNGVPANHATLMISLDRRRGATQARKATDPGE